MTIESATALGKSVNPHLLWRQWALSFGATTVFIFINTTTIWFSSRSGLFPNSPAMQFRWLLLEQLAHWYPIALLTPLLLWLASRYSFERTNWRQHLSIHLALNLGFHLVHTAISVPLMSFAEVEPATASTLLKMFLMRLLTRLPINTIIYLTIVGTGYAVDYYRRYREQEFQAVQLEARLIEAQLQALRMQLQPHFLFNTLHAISTLMEDDLKAARRMIARLSELLRLTLENAGQQKVPLRQELDALERYLEIEQIRFQDRLDVQMKIEPKALVALVPNLLLQPIVENAIRHGIAPSSNAGEIEISAERRNGHLILQVRDNGAGIAAGALTEGVGLTNTKTRLQQLYAEDFNLSLENSVRGGALVTIAIPFESVATSTHD